ncbi:MAG: glycerate kinase, partial [Gammaproteobacteria bacterium]|nr:glycerate kinase [Gemmatimonadota bacterium]NIU72257.1 glycerate kinase [Gammaproteobacteria bacterium]
GAAAVFAPQKGAGPAAVERLGRGLEQLALVAARAGPAARAEEPGAGAAGGLGFGIRFFGNGDLRPGAAWVLERAGFQRALAEGPALVVVGEGAFDETSLE